VFSYLGTVCFQAKGSLFSTPVDFGDLTNVEIAIEGNLELPKGIPYVQSIVNASGGSVHWFTASGKNVTVSGSTEPDWGWVDCQLGFIPIISMKLTLYKIAFGEPWWLAAQLTDPGGLVSHTALCALSKTYIVT